MQKQQTPSRRSRRKVRGLNGPREAAAQAPPRAVNVDIVERVVRTARPVQLEEADWVLDESTMWPVDEEAHPRPSRSASGTLSTDPEGQRLPVVEPGISIDPEDLGRQFLRDATEQDNFESLFEAIGVDMSATPLDQVISEASLEAAAQAGFAVPESGALGGRSNGREHASEPRNGIVNLASAVLRESSLFDQPTEDGDTRPPIVIERRRTKRAE
jgi:hypothetical protein